MPDPDPRIMESKNWEASWQAAVDAEEEQTMAKEATSFLDGAVLVARFILAMTEDRDQVPGSAVISFIAGHGLDINPEAAVIAKTEYEHFLRSLPDPIPNLEVDTLMLRFYEDLESIFQTRGVTM